MFIRFNKNRLLIIGLSMAALSVAAFAAVRWFQGPDQQTAGGNIHFSDCPEQGVQALSGSTGALLNEEFHRPSKQPALPNPYAYADFETADHQPPLISEIFHTPEEVILAYFGILENAANMGGYSGGCGTIGDATQPYPYAYELLTPESRSEMSLEQFIASFAGIGHITLLSLYPAYAPPETPPYLQYYMVEIETITGRNKQDGNGQGSYFAYYYGIVTVEETGEGGYKIKRIDYLPEDFLCAPYHGWSYDAEALVNIVYGENLRLIDAVEKIGQQDGWIHVYAAGNGRQYRFDFVRLTNGYDILLQENMLVDGEWQATQLLPDRWEGYKFSIRRFS